MTKVLFCGGYADGRWLDIPEALTEYRVQAPGTFRWDTNEKVEMEEQVYRIWPIQLLGYGMRVAALKNRHYESDDVIRALCQRDVAQHLTGRDRVTR